MTPDRRSVMGALRQRWASLLDVTPFNGKEIALTLAIAALGFVATAVIAFAGATRGQPAAVQTVSVAGPTVYLTPSASSAPQPANTTPSTAPATTAPTVAPSPVAPQHAIWHEGDVTIPDQVGADLDADANDRSWGQIANRNNPFTIGGAYDIWWWYGTLRVDEDYRQGVVIKAKPSYDACYGAPGGWTTTAGTDITSMRHGHILCVQTDQGRYAAVSYKGVVGNSIKVHIIAWTKDGD